MKYFRNLIYIQIFSLFATAIFADITFVKRSPDGVTPYDRNWSYADFQIEAGYQAIAVFGGFRRSLVLLPVTSQDYMVQYNLGTIPFTSLTLANQAWNYDLIDTSLYNVWTNIRANNFNGPGVLRVSIPTSEGANDGAIWDSVFILVSSPTIGCSKMPSATTYNGSWNYADFNIGTGFKAVSVFGGFRRNVPIASQDYIVQYNLGTIPFTSLTLANQAWNYDLIDTSLYNVWTSIDSNNSIGAGVLRVSTPPGAIWDSACVEIQPLSVGINFNHKMKKSNNPINRNRSELIINSNKSINGRKNTFIKSIKN